MKRRFIGLGIALCLLLSALLGTAAFAETEIGLTANLANGSHTETTGRAQFAMLPLPIFSIRHRNKRLEALTEALIPVGPISFPGSTVGQPQSSQLGYLSGVLRYYTANGRFYVGAGASEVLQRTMYVPSQFVRGSFQEIDGETDISRLAGARYEAGAVLASSPSRRIRLNLAALPSIHAMLAMQRSTSGTFVRAFEFRVPERASLVDASVAFEQLSGGLSLIYGVRYLNVTASFTNDGSLADRNRFVAPFIGLTRRI